MNLYIIRHAIAVEAGTPEYEDDSLRPLTDRGKKKMVRIAQGLKNLEVELDLILTSPYIRAAETAKVGMPGKLFAGGTCHTRTSRSGSL